MMESKEVRSACVELNRAEDGFGNHGKKGVLNMNSSKRTKGKSTKSNDTPDLIKHKWMEFD